MFKSSSTVALLSSFVVLAAASSGCSSSGDDDKVGAKVEIINKTSSALSVGTITAVHGTYGATCMTHDPGDPWTVDLPGGPAGTTTLAVVKDDSNCILSVTGLTSATGTYLADDPLAMTAADTYSATSSAFHLTGETAQLFFGNAKISTLDYTNAETITVLISDLTDATETGERDATNYATRSASVSEESSVPAPNYELGLTQFTMLKNANDEVDSVGGYALLDALAEGAVTGEDYAVYSGALTAATDVETIETIFAAATGAGRGGAISGDTQVAASKFDLPEGEDLTQSPERTIIVRRTQNGVSAYQLIVVTFQD